jgi:two-component system, NtrC family, sensor kinase
MQDDRVSRRGHVLVIDDDKLLASVYRRLLGKDHQIVAVNAASDALQLFEAGARFDIILCDLMMESMSGMTFHELVRARFPELLSRFVFITGGAYTDEARELLAVTPHIEKPADTKALRALVDEYVARGA